MSSNDKHSPHNHRGSFKISNNLILASMATAGVSAGVTINQVTTLAATEDTVPETVIAQPENPVSDETIATERPVVAEGNTEKTDSTNKISDHYTNAQNQVNDANGKAKNVNDSLAKLQELLNNSDLTSQPDWQTNLQNALDEYRNNATKFNDTTAKTQELITMYQEKINETIKDQPNAVNQVTDTETTGTKLADYQQLTDNFQKSVSEQLQIVQANLDNYAASNRVNQVSADLTTAANALNAGLVDSNKTSESIIKLKSNYDVAVTAYNAAVTAYNNNSGTTMATISSDDNPDITQIMSDLKIKEAYDTAVDKHQDVQEKTETYKDAVTLWQNAVKDYNDALTLLSMSDRTDDTALKAAQKEVEDAANKITAMQESYNATILNPDNQLIISNYLNVSKDNPDKFQDYELAQENYDKKTTALKKAEADLLSAQSKGRVTTYYETQVATLTQDLNKAGENLNAAKKVVTDIESPLKLAYDEVIKANKEVLQSYNDALIDLNDKLASWQNIYKDYGEAVSSASNSEQTFPDFDQLKESVDSSQTDVQTVLDEIDTSQAEYKAALDNYRTVLDNNGHTDVKEANGTLPDLSVLQKELIDRFSQNTEVMNATPKLIAVIKSESQLQQRIVQINNIVLAINSDQKMLKTIYNAIYQGDTWQALASSFNNISDDLVAKAADYQKAINGGDNALSYADLVAAFETAKGDYDISDISYTYPEVSDVSAQYETFNTDLAKFETSSKTLLDYLAKSSPNEEFNAAAVESMKDGTKLSTNGDLTSLDDNETGGSIINVYKYFGKDLEYFIGRSVGDTTANLRNDRIGDVENISIAEQDKEPAKSSTGTDYYNISVDKEAELNDLLHGMIVPFYEKDGVIYHLTGVMVPGADMDNVTYVNNLSDIYVFTSLDPVQEFMNMFTGISVDTNVNHAFNFYYTASPQKNVEDTTELSDTNTLPKLETFAAETLNSTGDWNNVSLTSNEETISNPSPNKVTESGSTIAGKYLGGEMIDNTFDALNIKQAPTITLNEVEDIPDPENPGTTDPGNPDIPDPENPGTKDPGNPDIPDPENPETTNPGDSDSEGIVDVPSNNNDIVYIPKTGQIYDSTVKISRNSQSNLIKAPDNTKLSKEFPQTGQESKGIWSLLGSLLLAISGFSLISIRKKD